MSMSTLKVWTIDEIARGLTNGAKLHTREAQGEGYCLDLRIKSGLRDTGVSQEFIYIGIRIRI